MHQVFIGKGPGILGGKTGQFHIHHIGGDGAVMGAVMGIGFGHQNPAFPGINAVGIEDLQIPGLETGLGYNDLHAADHQQRGGAQMVYRKPEYVTSEGGASNGGM